MFSKRFKIKSLARNGLKINKNVKKTPALKKQWVTGTTNFEVS